MRMRLHFLTRVFALNALLFGSLYGDPSATSNPGWWSTYSVIDSEAEADDYAAVNQGQLKHVATQAAGYLEDALEEVGGAGSGINALVGAWVMPSEVADDYVSINLGQLKHVASLFYDRLNDVAFGQWPNGMTIDPATGYPWLSSAEEADNYALANIGQLKWLFSWDLNEWATIDSDSDGLPDYWERFYFGDLTRDGSGDYDGDGIHDRHEYEAGTNPVTDDTQLSALRAEYDYDQAGRLTEVSGDFSISYDSDGEGNILSIQ